MAIQRERLNRKNVSGEYDTIHLETQADLILLASDPSKNVEQILGETVSIVRGGTGATTAAAGLYNLMAGLPEMSAEELAEDDLLCVLDVDANSAKMVALSVVGNGGGGTPEEPVTNPNWPDRSQLTLGNTISWVNQEWIVSYVTDTEAYLTLKGLSGESTWYNLQPTCTTFANKFTEAQKACLKSVTAGNTSGKVFVATRDQMDGGFSYFNSDSRRRLNEVYWTSTESGSNNAWLVLQNGRLNDYSIFDGFGQLISCGFRPSVCIDLTLYDTGSGGGSEEPELNPELPDKSSLTVGNTVTFANKQWIVAHVTSVEAYLTLKGLSGVSTWNALQNTCTSWNNSNLNDDQRACLKSITAGNTSGKVFVAAKDMMDGGFDYFNSDSKRNAYDVYWTSTASSSGRAWDVDSDGSFRLSGYASDPRGFRPSICIDLTLYNQ